ncbi:MAG: hypothetical protein ACOX6M_12860 [Armatimonadota bacterium]
MPKPTQEELEYINSRFATTPLTEDDVFVWERAVVNSIPVSHGFRIHPETLDEFLNDIKQGVPRLVGHESRGRVPIGRTFDGWLDWRESLEDGTPYEVLYAKSYMLRNQKIFDGLNTDDLIRGIEAGINFAESIGFGERAAGLPIAYECGICSAPIDAFWWWLMPTCDHRPWKWYDDDDEVPDGEGQQNIPVIRNASLSEISLVYNGAAQNVDGLARDMPTMFSVNGMTLSAGATKSLTALDTSTYDHTVTSHNRCHLFYRRWQEEGELPKGWTEARLKREHSECVKRLLDEYSGFHAMRDELDDSLNKTLKKKSKGGDSMAKQAELKLDETVEITTKAEEAVGKALAKNEPAEKIDEVLEELAEKTEKFLAEELLEKGEAVIRDVLNSSIREALGLGENARLEDALTAIEELKTLSGKAKEVRKKNEEDALKWGVRAMGDDFPKDIFEKQFASMSDEELDATVNAFKAQAKKLFPDKRLTESTDLEASNDKVIKQEAERRAKAAGIPMKEEG